MAKLITAADIRFRFIGDLLSDVKWMFKTVEVMTVCMTGMVFDSAESEAQYWDFVQAEVESQAEREYYAKA